MTILSKHYRHVFIWVILVLSSCAIHAQSIEQYVSKGNKVQQAAPREIVYIQTDKPSYLLGDTIWYSAYVVDAYEHKPSTLSGIAYVEFVNPSNGLVKRYAIHLALGHGFAQIPLDIKMTPGNYRIRAYTRWMENFSDSLFFQKEIPVLGGVHNWFMDVSSYRQIPNGTQDSVNMNFSLKDQGGKVASNRMVTLQLTNTKGKALFSKEILTKDDGSLKIDFIVANNKKKNESYSLNVLDGNKVQRISYPISTINNPQQIDIQFLPESGHLIAGMENNVAFKAIDANGIGTEVKGIIRNSKGDSVAAFSSINKGMGVLQFTPQPNEKYYGVVNNYNPIPLPVVENSGTILHVDNLSNKDSVRVHISITPDLQGQHFFILGKNKGYVLYGAKITMSKLSLTFSIAKSNFLNGISYFSLLKTNGQQLNERAFFCNNQNHLKVDWHFNTVVNTKDSIPFSIKVSDWENKPIQGIFSLAVTDKQQVAKNENADENILSYLLLSSDLKGNIESPGYYFHDNSTETQKALDVLMMTQGFVKYDWDTTKMTITPEPDFQVTGKATTLFGKGAKKANIVLLGTKNQTIIKDTTADDNGNFVFNDFPLFDTSSFVIQARNKKNKTFGIGIEINSQKFPIINNLQSNIAFPTNVNMDTTLKKRVDIYDKYVERKYGKNELLDVTVTTKARVEGSKNLNGPGQYDQAITKSDLEQMDDSTLLEILKSKLKSFYVGTCGKDPAHYYMTQGNYKIRFVFDGIPLDFFYDPPAGTRYPYLDFVTQYLKYYTAKDIKGIEIMHSSKYSSSYIDQYLTFQERLYYNPVMGCPYTYIEITTYGQQGPFLKQNSSIYLYRPQPFSYGMAFYQPKYINRSLQDNHLPDVRSTIYWAPMLITDKNGEAKLSFYSAGLPTNYQFWLEGMDLDGNIGFSTKNVEVKE